MRSELTAKQQQVLDYLEGYSTTAMVERIKEIKDPLL